MANLMMPDADPEFKAYLKERVKKEATTDYHSLKEDFDDWKKHRKPKKAYLGTFIYKSQSCMTVSYPSNISTLII